MLIDDEVRRRRGDRWLRPVDSIEEAGAHIDDLGFVLLFPADGIEAPSLWEAVAGEDARPFDEGMGPDEERVWAWKDELPLAGLAWYGKFLHRRASLLSLDVLEALYPGRGKETDHQTMELSREAHDIVEALRGGPLTTAALRQLVGDKARCDRAVGELYRRLLVTSAGVERRGSGWPAAVLDLTCRAFSVGRRADVDHVTRRYLATMLVATVRDLSHCLGWSVPDARTRLGALVAAGGAEEIARDVYAAR